MTEDSFWAGRQSCQVVVSVHAHALRPHLLNVEQPGVTVQERCSNGTITDTLPHAMHKSIAIKVQAPCCPTRLHFRLPMLRYVLLNDVQHEILMLFRTSH